MMFNGQVGFNVQTYQTVEELVESFERCHTWTLCTGFRIDNLVLLNDSASENGAQEYAVIQIMEEDDEVMLGWQFESYTMSWMSHERKIEAITEALKMTLESYLPESFKWVKSIKLAKHGEGSCPHCS
jgi:hypothetical protein